MAITRPRGTRDTTPESMQVRRGVEKRMRTTLERYGYREVQTPVFEHMELFTAKSGDAIKEELYAFEDKAGRSLALRPELTAAVMRFFHNELSVEPRPLKLWYLANCFRYDRPQKGRYREFWQVGCEIIGSDRPEANAELIALTTQLLHDAGLREIDVRIGHIAILHGLLAAIGAPGSESPERGPLMRAIDKRDEKSIRGILEKNGAREDAVAAFLRLGEADPQGGSSRSLEATRDLLASGQGEAVDQAQAALEELQEALDLLESMAPPHGGRFDPMIARGLDYYTGLVFEVDAPRLGAEKQVAGGGGYDLSSVFGSERIPTTGFALGFDRLMVALEAEEALPEPGPWLDVYLAAIGDAQRPLALQLAQALRAGGVRVEVDLMRRPPGKNLKAADAHQARWALLLGEKEREAGTVTVKDLATGDQQAVAQDRLVEHLQSELERGAS